MAKVTTVGLLQSIRLLNLFGLKDNRRLRLLRSDQTCKKSLILDQSIPSFLTVGYSFLSFLTVMAASGDNKKLIDESESFYEKKEFLKMYELLASHAQSDDPDVLWRLARAATEKGKIEGGDSRKKHIYEAWEHIKKALELGPSNFACHKWYGILLDYTGEYEGTKQRISNAFLVKDHFKKAIELNPKDATSMYCLGVWCFLFADMPWYQRKVAGVLFASPPTSSYDEALEYFEMAEKAEPNFFNKNKVMMGKTLIRLKKNDDAQTHLLTALQHEDKTTDDIEARKEAKDLLKEIGVKV